jgi:hypothetical protein
VERHGDRIDPRHFGREARPRRSRAPDVLPLATMDQKREAIGTLLPLIKYRPVDERISLSEAIARRARVTPPSDLMLTTPQLRELAAARNITIGAHTRRHPILACTAAVEAEAEICRLAQQISKRCSRSTWTSSPIPTGVPDKDYRAEHVEMVRQGWVPLRGEHGPGSGIRAGGSVAVAQVHAMG